MRLSAVMTKDPARRAAVEAKYPGTRVVGTFEELMSLTPALDHVAISTPNASHFPLARAVLEAGRHVSVDKTFASTGLTTPLNSPDGHLQYIAASQGSPEATCLRC